MKNEKSKTTELGNNANLLLSAVIRPEYATEALSFLKNGQTIEVQNDNVGKLIKFAHQRENDFAYSINKDKLNKGWSVIQNSR